MQIYYTCNCTLYCFIVLLIVSFFTIMYHTSISWPHKTTFACPSTSILHCAIDSRWESINDSNPNNSGHSLFMSYLTDVSMSSICLQSKWAIVDFPLKITYFRIHWRSVRHHTVVLQDDNKKMLVLRLHFIHISPRDVALPLR